MISQHGIQPKNVCMLLTFGVTATAATTTSHISRVTTLAQKMLFAFCKKLKKTCEIVIFIYDISRIIIIMLENDFSWMNGLKWPMTNEQNLIVI